MLKKEVRKTLIETKELKEKQLIEHQIVESRLLSIFEGLETKKDYDTLPTSKKVKLTKHFISEINFLSENQLLSESFLESMKSLFGGSFESILQTMMEPIVGSVLGTLGIKKGKFRNIMVSLLTSRPSELISSLGNCEMMTKLIVKSFIEAEVMFLQQEAGLDGMVLSFVRNRMGSAAENIELIQKLESNFGHKICEILDRVKSNTENIIKKLQTNSNGISTNLLPEL